VNLVKMFAHFAFPHACKTAAGIIAFLLRRMHIVVVAVESLSCVKLPFAHGAPDHWALARVWCNGRCCRYVLVNMGCRLWLTMVYRRGTGPAMARIEVGPRDLVRQC
jgi:hypothetical protein